MSPRGSLPSNRRDEIGHRQNLELGFAVRDSSRTFPWQRRELQAESVVLTAP